MPGNINRRLAAVNDNGPLGKGTVCSQILDISAQTRRRAIQLNECESSKLQISTKSIDRHARYCSNASQKAMDRINKSLTILEAYRDVVKNDYKVDRFESIQPGFNLKQALRDPARKRRSTYETRIYNSGFSIKNLKPEIERRLRELDPSTQRATLLTTMLEESRRRNEVLIDRNMPFASVVKTMMGVYSNDGSSSVHSFKSNYTAKTKKAAKKCKPIQVTKSMASVKTLAAFKNLNSFARIGDIVDSEMENSSPSPTKHVNEEEPSATLAA